MWYCDEELTNFLFLKVPTSISFLKNYRIRSLNPIL